MARRITTGVLGGPILGKFTAKDNNLETIEPNADIILQPDGSGQVKSNAHLQLNDNSTLRLADADSSNYIAFAAPATINSNVTYTFPGSGVTADYFLKTDTNGTLSWAEAAVQISNSTTDTTTYYLPFTTSTTGTITSLTVTNTKLTFQPSSGTLTATIVATGNASITGGNIDGTTIGGTTAAVGTFTTVNATTINETSSIAYKENVAPIENALDKILQLVGVIYDRKDGSRKGEAGLIAEDVAVVIPNIVTYKDGKPDGLSYTKLTAYLIESVKELTQEVRMLKDSR
jgi:hypothetical protein